MTDLLADWGSEWGLDADTSRLAALLSLAGRVEPELLRAVRVGCLPDADVDSEQALWFSTLVDARSEGGISFDPTVLDHLRVVLAEAYPGPARPLIDLARFCVARVHADISPLLRVEEDLVWTAVTRDHGEADRLASSLVQAVAAQRPGIRRWLARVWPSAPEPTRRGRAGWVLSHVAGERPAASPGLGHLTDLERAALLTTVPDVALHVGRNRSALRLGVREDEAQATLHVPDTVPRLLEITPRVGPAVHALAVVVVDGRPLVATGDARGRILLSDPEGEGVVSELKPGGSPIRALAASADGRLLVSLAAAEPPRLWDLADRSSVGIDDSLRDVRALALDPAGSWLACASKDGTISLWNLPEGRPLRALTAHRSSIAALCAGPDGTWLASGGQDGSVRIWDVATGTVRDAVEGPSLSTITALVAFSGGAGVIVATGDGLWQTEVSGRVTGSPFSYPPRGATALALSPEGSWLALGAADGDVEVWDPAQRAPGRVVARHAGAVTALAASPDGRWLASAGDDGAVQVTDPYSHGSSRTAASGPRTVELMPGDTVDIDLAELPARLRTIRGDVYALDTRIGDSISYIRVRDTYHDGDGPFAERGASALVAIIDDGIDVLHEAFRDADGLSRIIGVWDQTDPEHVGDVPYGRLHAADDVADYVRDGVVPERLQASGRHGTAVASIAAGRRCGIFGGGVAPEAKLLIVVSGADRAIGYSAAYSAALQFIDATAAELGLPVVVNVSQGINTGAHDGLSSLEAEFDSFAGSGRHRGRVVVMAAGNERDKRGHAALTVPPGTADELLWRCPSGPARTVQLELWWSPDNHYRFRLRSPDGRLSAWVDRSESVAEGVFPDQGDYSLELVSRHEDNADSLLRVRHHAVPDRTTEWTLEVAAVQVPVAGDIHAWIERGSQPPTEFLRHISEEMTLSVPGTAHSVITVGAVDVGPPLRVAPFSAFGPVRGGAEDRPDLCAPGVDIEGALPGSRDGVVTMDSTSMAAAHVSGAVALVLSRTVGRRAPLPTTSQVRALLRRNTRSGNKYWDRGLGYGVLDVTQLLEAGLPTLL